MLLAIGGACAILAAFVLFWHPPKQLGQSAAPIDLLAFYCGARVLPADPYNIEPLRTCQHAAFFAATGLSEIPGLVVPAPLPPFALSLLRPLAMLPFALARATWLTAILLTSVPVVVALCKLGRVWPPLLTAAVVLGTVVPCAILGQLVPFVLVALAGATLFVQQRRWGLASFFSALTLFEPQLGLPLCFAVLLLVPTCRRSLLRWIGALAAVSLTSGLYRNLEYLTSVLPAHARSEVSAFMWQYSLSALLVEVGLPATPSLALGSVSYLAMTGLAIFAARRIVPEFGLGAVVAVPAAFALLGGTYIHAHQMAFAVPLIVLLSQRYKAEMTAVLCAISIPWQVLQEAGALHWAFPASQPATYDSIASSLGTVHRGGGRLAEDVWSIWVRSYSVGAGSPIELLLFKLPVWCALCALVYFTLRTGRRLTISSSLRSSIDLPASASRIYATPRH
jgi:hypothetical protein